MNREDERARRSVGMCHATAAKIMQDAHDEARGEYFDPAAARRKRLEQALQDDPGTYETPRYRERRFEME